MAAQSNTATPLRVKLFVALVFAAGTAATASSASDLLLHPPSNQWLLLVVLGFLTLISGFLPVKLPKVSADISVSETFVFAATLLFGASAGVIVVFFDALLIRVKRSVRSFRWPQMLFSISAPPLSIYLAGQVLFRVMATPPLATPGANQPDVIPFVAGLGLFTILYYLLNSFLVATVIAIGQKTSPFGVWYTNFSQLWLNYLAGASIAALLVYRRPEISVVFLFVIAPLMLVLFLTYRWSMERVEKAEKHIEEMNRVFLSTIEALAMAIDAKDQVTHGHIRRVQQYTMALANALGVKEEGQLKAIEAAALLHDTGKLAVPEYILNKPGPLTSSEFERMKLHAAVGADILKGIDFPYPVEPIVRHHHENWDGTGYPDGIKGQDIPLGARILSVVDCYDALTSDRPYRPRMVRAQAEQILRDRRGSMYDPWVVDAFMGLLDKLEKQQASQGTHGANQPASQGRLTPAQLDFISATTAEEREFAELRRELPKAATLTMAAETLFRHVRRVIPAATVAFYTPGEGTNDLVVSYSAGVGAPTIQQSRVPVGERVSGWAFAHKQTVLNSDAALELGPVARTYSTPLRYALAVPVMDGGHAVGVLALFSGELFDKDHRRMLESAASLLASSAPGSPQQDLRRHPEAQEKPADPKVH